MYGDQPVHELVSVSTGILLRELNLDLVIGQAIQISSIYLIQRLPAFLRPLYVLGCLDGPATLVKLDIAQMTQITDLLSQLVHTTTLSIEMLLM